ncbi:MAG TPA: CAP domain-containing protein [Ktedonobacteraceae bacterium]|nr:CAP domain-containing protein [Ktedonobacteraceae bacterium]
MRRNYWPIFFLLCLLTGCQSASQASQSSQLAPTRPSASSLFSTPISISGQPTPAKVSPTARSASQTATKSATGTPALTPTSQVQQLAQYVFGLINQSRAAQGLRPYAWGGALAGGARLHNQRMIAYGQLSHQCPGEPALGARISADGIQWQAAGENIGWASYTNAQQGLLSIHQSMMAEQPPNDGHRQNILNTNYNLLGVDVVIDSKGQVWLTEDFAEA